MSCKGGASRCACINCWKPWANGTHDFGFGGSNNVCPEDRPYVSGDATTCGCMSTVAKRLFNQERCCVKIYECYGDCGESDTFATWLGLGVLFGLLLLLFCRSRAPCVRRGTGVDDDVVSAELVSSVSTSTNTATIIAEVVLAEVDTTEGNSVEVSEAEAEAEAVEFSSAARAIALPADVAVSRV